VGCLPMRLRARWSLVVGVLVLASLAIAHGQSPEKRRETLYNGILLPSPWPPRLSRFPVSVETDPVTPPYLLSPPDVIPIDVGRQLFVDDFLTAETTLKRPYHLAKYYAGNPIIKPDQTWESGDKDQPAAMTFSDGVWHDPSDHLFKIWYMAGGSASTCYAT